MAAKDSSAALLKAAKKGDVAKLRELLDGGAPIEATDLNKCTAVMLAAKEGHVDAFRLLVERQANLLHLGLTDVDLLECAAEGGNVEIIQFLIDQGHPLEGHWKPRSQFDKRLGHITALQVAAMNGHVEAVRVLLAAGADRNAKFDGDTALVRAQSDIKHPIGDDQARLKPQFEEIVALLKGSVAKGKSAPTESADPAQQFAANAKRPEFIAFRKKLDQFCGPHKSWKPLADHGHPVPEAVVYKVKDAKKLGKLEKLQSEARAAGCHLVGDGEWLPGEPATLMLFPTDDKFAVIAAIGVEGANDMIRNADVVDWLKELDKTNPFDLAHCSHDLVAGIFPKPVKAAKELAEQMAQFCPNCLDGDCETLRELAGALKREKAFMLYWD